MSSFFTQNSHSPAFAGLFSGLLLIGAVFALNTPIATAIDPIFSGIALIATFVIISLIAGRLTKSNTPYPYVASCFGVLYIYASLQLITGLTIIHPILLVIAAAPFLPSLQ